MKNLILLLTLSISISLSAQNIGDTTKLRAFWVSTVSFEVQTHSYDDINNTLLANNYPSLDNTTLRVCVGGRVQKRNSGITTGYGFEWMRYTYAANNSVGNRTSLSDVGLNLMLGYNFLHKKSNMILLPHYRLSFVYRDLVLTTNKNYSAATFNNFLNSNITTTSLSNIATNLDLGLTFETNFFKTKREQTLIGLSAGYRISLIQGFGENETFRITDASGRYSTANLGGFYFSLNVSSYWLKNKGAGLRNPDLQ